MWFLGSARCQQREEADNLLFADVYGISEEVYNYAMVVCLLPGYAIRLVAHAERVIDKKASSILGVA